MFVFHLLVPEYLKIVPPHVKYFFKKLQDHLKYLLYWILLV